MLRRFLSEWDSLIAVTLIVKSQTLNHWMLCNTAANNSKTTFFFLVDCSQLCGWWLTKAHATLCADTRDQSCWSGEPEMRSSPQRKSTHVMELIKSFKWLSMAGLLFTAQPTAEMSTHDAVRPQKVQWLLVTWSGQVFSPLGWAIKATINENEGYCWLTWDTVT